MPNITTVDVTATVVQLRASGKSKVSCLTIQRKQGATQDLYLQLFDANAPTVGVTAPNDVVMCKAPATGNKSILKVVYAGKYGGRMFDTALAIAVTTTPTGSTAPTAGQEPTISVCYAPLT